MLLTSAVFKFFWVWIPCSFTFSQFEMKQVIPLEHVSIDDDVKKLRGDFAHAYVVSLLYFFGSA